MTIRLDIPGSGGPRLTGRNQKAGLIKYHVDGKRKRRSQSVADQKPTVDRKETFGIEYDPRLDLRGNPETTGSDTSYYALHDSIWENVSHLQGFRDVTITFWQHRLELARKLVQIFALALDLPETYFDDITTHPGADGLYIHYPGTPDADKVTDFDVGIGSHTGIQCFTLLWQDMSGGLQVLSASGEWLNAHPIPGTIVVNIADFLSRLSNNRFKSTVHRVYNRQEASRYSMPFFFGFNPDSTCAVVPTCVDEEHPPLYDPISCGKVGFFLFYPLLGNLCRLTLSSGIGLDWRCLEIQRSWCSRLDPWVLKS